MNEIGNASPGTDEAAQQEQTPGALLRKLREEAGLSHAAVGEALHLTVHYVKALENDAYDKLPGITFVKGYLRSYARYMKADVDAVLASFDKHVAGLAVEGQRTEQVQRTRRRHDQALRWAIATSVILVLGIAGGWWFRGTADSAATPVRVPQQVVAQSSARDTTVVASPAVSAPTQVPAVAPPATLPAVTASTTFSPASSELAVSPALADEAAILQPDSSGGFSPAVATMAATTAMDATSASPSSPALATPDASIAAAEEVPAAVQQGDELTVSSPAGDGSRQVNLVSGGDDLLELSFSGNSWVEIDDGSDTRLYNDMLRAGDALTIHGSAPFHLLLGAAANVTVRFNAEAVEFTDAIRADSTARLVLGADTLAGALR